MDKGGQTLFVEDMYTNKYITCQHWAKIDL